MSDYIVTQQDLEILLQQTKVVTYRLELLNSNMKVIDTLEGNLISDNISIDSSSDVRRTYTCELVVTNSSFKIGTDTKIWFDKLVRPYIGILHQRSQEIKYYLLGTFLFTDMNYNYDCSTNTLSLTCKDMMCLLNDTRKGQIDAYKRTIKANDDARKIIISLLEQMGITKYFIEFNINNKTVPTYSIPYELNYEAGTTVYKIINDIVEMYPGTQMFFDKDGIFNIKRIPTTNNESIILDNNILNQLVISESFSTSFSEIYNKIIIWGKVHEPDFYSTQVSMSGSCYNVTVFKDTSDENKINWVTYDKYSLGDKIAIKIPTTNLDNATINVNGLGVVPIVYEDNTVIKAGLLDKNQEHIFRYRLDGEKLDIPHFVYLGQYQSYGEAYLTNNEKDTNTYAVIDKDNKFSIEHIGTITKVLTGSDVENIYTNTLCDQRCRHELYNNTNGKDTLSLTTIAIPWLDVNQTIRYKSKATNEECDYLVSNISCNYVEHKMTIQLNKYFPQYINKE